MDKPREFWIRDFGPGQSLYAMRTPDDEGCLNAPDPEAIHVIEAGAYLPEGVVWAKWKDKAIELEALLKDAHETIHYEFCGSGKHHDVCSRLGEFKNNEK